MAYGCLLRNELLGAQIEELRGPPATCADGNRAALGAVQLASAAKAAVAYSPPVFRFRAPAHSAEVSFINLSLLWPQYTMADIGQLQVIAIVYRGKWCRMADNCLHFKGIMA